VTQAERDEARLGSGYWSQYVQLNGYAFAPTREGLQKLARNLDLTIGHLQRCITRYLEA
jgi:hypothetical protein